jgi:hypothetical protein
MNIDQSTVIIVVNRSSATIGSMGVLLGNDQRWQGWAGLTIEIGTPVQRISKREMGSIVEPSSRQAKQDQREYDL